MIFKILIIIILIILLIHYKSFKKINKDINIIQFNEFNKNAYEKSISLKQPIILYDFLLELNSFNELSFESLKDIDNLKIIVNKNEINLNEYIEKIEKNDFYEIDFVYLENNFLLSYFDLNLKNELNLLTSPLSIHTSKNITIAPIDYLSPLVYTNFERNIFLIYEGLVEFYIYKPSDINNLYFNKKDNIYYQSEIVDIFNIDNKNNYENFKNTNYITIKLYKGQVLILPNNYPYSYKIIEPSLIINSKSDSFFSFLFNLKNIA